MEIINLLFFKVGTPLLVLCVLILVHEYGHYIVAKLCGVGVMKFSIGFGPVLMKWRKKETDYQLSLIPLGGYVRMVGDMPDSITGPQASDEMVRQTDQGEVTNPRAAHPLGMPAEEDMSPELRSMINDKDYWFLEKNYWQKSAIVFAGPLFNFLFAIFCIALSLFAYGETKWEDGTKLGRIMEGSPAEKAGLLEGDIIHSVAGKTISTWEAMAEEIQNSEGKAVQLEVIRQAESGMLLRSLTPELRVAGPNGEQRFMLGVERSQTKSRVNLIDSFVRGVKWTGSASYQTVAGLYGMIRGQVNASELAGPIYILDAAGDTAKRGMPDLLFFTAILSVSLAVLNLLPIPILDGGHLLIFTVEKLFGEINIKVKETAQQLGVLFILSLMVFALYNDISRETPNLEDKAKWDNLEPEKKGETNESHTEPKTSELEANPNEPAVSSN